MKEKLLHQVFVIIAQGQVKMTLRCNICFEYRLTLKVIKLAIFFRRNSQSIEYCKTRIEDLKTRGSLYSCSASSQRCFSSVFRVPILLVRTSTIRKPSSWGYDCVAFWLKYVSFGLFTNRCVLDQSASSKESHFPQGILAVMCVPLTPSQGLHIFTETSLQLYMC